MAGAGSDASARAPQCDWEVFRHVEQSMVTNGLEIGNIGCDMAVWCIILGT